MGEAVLYVASRKASSGGSPNAPPVYFNSMNFPAGSAGSPRDFMVFKSEDEEVVNLLRGKGVAFETVDLTRSPLVSRLRFRLSEMKTPTLVMNGRKLVGLQKIKEALEGKEI
jgi:glutaredoxin